ncbi:MAG: DUF2177 family protein [Henriciella sp.]|uniref:DUF2177 family protein n=1 Tax=Henriciella sp. TaxID=1968823 RepID=UPI003C748BF0
MIKTYLTAYIGAGLVFAIVDLIWLGWLAKGFYNSQLGDLRAEQVKLLPAILFYLAMIAGLTYFAIVPELGSPGLWGAALKGAAFGFCCYMTYDLTNLATTRGWPPLLTAVDIVWGSLLSGIAAAGGAMAARLVS